MSKKDIVNMIVETYSAQSKADKEFLDLHAPIITTHYSPQYPDMDDILTARHFNTYVRREHGRNHPVAGEAFSKANQTRNAMYNQDHGYMPDEDSNYSFPHPHSLSEQNNRYFARHLTAFNNLVKKHGLERHWFSLGIGGANNFGLEGDDPNNPKDGFFIDTDSNHYKAMNKEATRVEHSELPDGTPAKTMWFKNPEEAMKHVEKIVIKHKPYFHGRKDNVDATTPAQFYGSRWTLNEGRVRNFFHKLGKELSDLNTKGKEKQAQYDSAKVRKGKMSADSYWEKHKHGTYHAADGNKYHYRRTVDKSGQHQLHVRKVGSKSASHETFHINHDWSNEQGMRHHKGPSHIEHLYSNPETKPKLEMNEMVMLRPHSYPELIDNFPHMDPFRQKPSMVKGWKPDLKKPTLSPDVDKVAKAVAHHLKTDHKIVTEKIINKPYIEHDNFPNRAPKSNKPKPWKPNPNSHMTDMSGTNTRQPMTEERFVIKYVLKDTLEEGVTKPWNDPEKAVAHAHKMMASHLYEAVEVVDESVWRHVNKVALGVTGASSAKVISGGNPIAGFAGLVAGWKSGYHIGKLKDVDNQVDDYVKKIKKYGKEHPETKKSHSKLHNIINQSSTEIDYGGADSSERHYFRDVANAHAKRKYGLGPIV